MTKQNNVEVSVSEINAFVKANKAVGIVVSKKQAKEVLEFNRSSSIVDGKRAKRTESLFASGYRHTDFVSERHGGKREITIMVMMEIAEKEAGEVGMALIAERELNGGAELKPSKLSDPKLYNKIQTKTSSRFRDYKDALYKMAAANGEVEPTPPKPRKPRTPKGEGSQKEESNKSAKTIVIESLLNAKKKLEADHSEVKHYKRVIAAIEAALAAVTDDSEL